MILKNHINEGANRKETTLIRERIRKEPHQSENESGTISIRRRIARTKRNPKKSHQPKKVTPATFAGGGGKPNKNEKNYFYRVFVWGLLVGVLAEFGEDSDSGFRMEECDLKSVGTLAGSFVD